MYIAYAEMPMRMAPQEIHDYSSQFSRIGSNTCNGDALFAENWLHEFRLQTIIFSCFCSFTRRLLFIWHELTTSCSETMVNSTNIQSSHKTICENFQLINSQKRTLAKRFIKVILHEHWRYYHGMTTPIFMQCYSIRTFPTILKTLHNSKSGTSFCDLETK